MWPRDALYISYKDEKFEYVNDLEANDEPVYYWWVKKCTSSHVNFEIKCFFFVNLIYSDCCDPSRQQKKRGHSDSEEDDSEGSEEGSDEEEDEDKTSTTSSLETKTEAKSEVKSEATPNTTPTTTTTTTNNPLQPGWFGKGRRKRARCWDLIFEKPPFTWLVNANCKQIMWLAGQCVGHQNTNLVTMMQKDFYNPTQSQMNNDLNIMHGY